MTEKYKVRGAMLALREFTGEDLARHSGVNPRTIHTELIRAGDLVEKLPPAAGPKARGGQRLRYRVRVPRLEALRRQLETEYSALSQIFKAAESVPAETPLALQVAEDAVDRRAEAPAGDRPHLLDVTDLQLRSVERQIATLGSAPSQRAIARELTQRIAAVRQRLDRAQGKGKDPSAFVLVDADGGRLVHRIDAVVDLSRVVSATLGSARLHKEIEQGIQGLAYSFFIVALDSDHTELNRRRLLADAIIRVAAEPGRSVFIDSGFDDKLRNYVFEHGCLYVGGASSLKPAALRGLLRGWHQKYLPLASRLRARPEKMIVQPSHR